MFGFVRNGEIRKAIEEAVGRVAKEHRRALRERLEGFQSVEALQAKILSLRENIETLKIEKARKQEEYDRREREVEHKVGLERKRQEFESEATKREVRLEVREENLDADRKRFEEQMKFERERLEKQVDALNSLVEKLLVRLPSAEIFAEQRRPAGP